MPVSKKRSNETPIQRTILDALLRLGYVAWRNQQIPVPIRRGRAIVGLRRADPYTVGQPDIMMIRKGQLIGIEVKDKAKQTEQQCLWERRIKEAGGLYTVAHSWEEVEAFLRSTL